MVGKIIGIDASRNRSGGAVAHMVGILCEGDPKKYGIKHVHFWANKALMKKIPDFPWLSKHISPILEKSIVHQLLWQYFILPRIIKRKNCDVLFNTDAGSVCPFVPCITLSQDLLSFEPNEMKRYGLSKERLRLELLRLMQSRSLTRSSIAVFLTDYAKNTIQKTIGVQRSVVIAHGVGAEFHGNSDKNTHSVDQKKRMRCIYISNAALYKHQWHVMHGVEIVRNMGNDLTLLLVGGGAGRAQKKLEHQLRIIDPHNKFIKQIPFVPHENIPELLAGADIFIFASSCESLPITLLEAMASGLPIVCSDRGPMPEVLQDGGIYFDPENPASIARAITTIVSDSALRKKIASRAKALSEKYTWKKCAAETWAVLSQVS